MPDMAVKFAAESDREIRGLAIPFGGPIAGKDIDGEAFSRETDLCLDWFPNGRPLLYHHGLDGAVKTAVIGRQTEVEIDDEGAWVKAELDKRSRWYSRVKQLIDEGATGFSSGAMAHLVRTRKDGQIMSWPWVELTLTPTNANPAATVYAIKSDLSDFFPDETEADDSGPESFDVHVKRVASDVTALVERATARVELRAGKSGRELSASNRAELQALAESLASLEQHNASVKALLTRTDPDARKAIEELEAELLVSELRRAGIPV